MLRRHQKDIAEISDRSECGTDFTTTIAHVTPGGGKSLLPFLMGSALIRRGIVNKILWVVPRLSLVSQGEESSIGSLCENLVGHPLPLEAPAGNSALLRGWPADGFGLITTHQSVESNSILYSTLMEREPTLLVVDECHHLAEESITAKAFAPLYRNAAYRLLMTGTMERNLATESIFGIEYEDNGRGARKPTIRPRYSDVVYSRRDALEEQAVVPVYHERIDGKAEWIELSGQESAGVDSLMEADDTQVGKALRSALSTEYAEDVLTRTVSAWQRYRELPDKGGAKLLVVAPNKDNARHYTKFLKSQGLSADIAISKDRGDTGEMSVDALANIERFKGKGARPLDVLVSVGMAYEGLDVPEITHVACLTEYRSRPWLEQMLARATRFCQAMGSWESQAAYVFSPADPKLTKVLDQIRKEDEAVLKERRERDGGDGTEGGEPKDQSILPVGSAITRSYAEDGQTGDLIAGEEWDQLARIREAAGYGGSLEQMKNLFAMRDSVLQDDTVPKTETPISDSRTALTQSARRKAYLKRLTTCVNGAAGPHMSQLSPEARGALFKGLNNVINDYLDVTERKDNSTISLDALAEAVSHFETPHGKQELSERASVVARGASVSRLR